MPSHRRTPSRRLFLTGVVAAGAALAACAPGDKDHSYAVAGGDGPEFPNLMTHQFGSTRIQARPERIVALGRGDADALLALGVRPVAVLDWFKAWPQGVGPWAQPRLGGAMPELLTGPELGVGRVATIAPDLVTFVRSDGSRATWQRLNALAPTISGPSAARPYGTTWQDQMMTVAGAIVRPADGRRLVDGTEAAIAAARRANPGFAGRTVCVATAFGGRYQAYVRQDDRVGLLEAIGFVNAPQIERMEPRATFAGIQREDAAWLDADLTVVVTVGAGAGMRNDPFLKSIPSAKAGRLLIIDDAELAHSLSANTVLSIPYALERFVPLARKALGC